MAQSAIPNPARVEDDACRILAAAHDSMRKLSGDAQDLSGRTHISPLEYKRALHFLRNYHLEMVTRGYTYQFLEVFLSGILFKQGQIKHTSAEDNSLFASSAIRIKDGAKFDFVDPQTMARSLRSHPSELTMANIEVRIENLAIRAQRYLFADGAGEPDPEYEYFRYFCIKTLFAYLIESGRFQFGSLGISAFFDVLLADKDEKGSFSTFDFLRRWVLIRGTSIPQLRRERLERLMNHQLGGKIIEHSDLDRELQRHATDGGDEERIAIDFYRTAVMNIDALSLLIITHRRHMPLPCYEAFFGFATNRYPAWVSSFTKPHYESRETTFILPGREIARELGYLNKTVHCTPCWRSTSMTSGLVAGTQ